MKMYVLKISFTVPVIPPVKRSLQDVKNETNMKTTGLLAICSLITLAGNAPDQRWWIERKKRLVK
jgi:hypothetical protein